MFNFPHTSFLKPSATPSTIPELNEGLPVSTNLPNLTVEPKIIQIET